MTRPEIIRAGMCALVSPGPAQASLILPRHDSRGRTLVLLHVCVGGCPFLNAPLSYYGAVHAPRAS